MWSQLCGTQSGWKVCLHYACSAASPSDALRLGLAEVKSNVIEKEMLLLLATGLLRLVSH